MIVMMQSSSVFSPSPIFSGVGLLIRNDSEVVAKQNEESSEDVGPFYLGYQSLLYYFVGGF